MEYLARYILAYIRLLSSTRIISSCTAGVRRYEDLNDSSNVLREPEELVVARTKEVILLIPNPTLAWISFGLVL